jgi:hypothetical protein
VGFSFPVPTLSCIVFGEERCYGSMFYCPGRFFAVSTLRLMLAYLVVEFELRPSPEDGRPERVGFGGVRLLKEGTVVRMRKRVENSKEGTLRRRFEGIEWFFVL